MQHTIQYIFDPLCGWCFGFSPVIKKLQEHYKDDIKFETLCGGMVLGDNIKPLSEMKGYLSEAMPRLEALTGVKFGADYYKLLEEGTVKLDSEMPSIAMMVYKSMSGNDTIAFAAALQNNLYVKGENLNSAESYHMIAKDFELDWSVFKERLGQQKYKEQAYAEFKKSAELGIQGFPSVIFYTKDKAYLIAKGYRNYEEMVATFSEIIKKEEVL